MKKMKKRKRMKEMCPAEGGERCLGDFPQGRADITPI